MTMRELTGRVAQVRVGIITPDALRAMCSESEWAMVMQMEPNLDEYRAMTSAELLALGLL